MCKKTVYSKEPKCRLCGDKCQGHDFWGSFTLADGVCSVCGRTAPGFKKPQPDVKQRPQDSYLSNDEAFWESETGDWLHSNVAWNRGRGAS